jgi:hypothetical protein
MRPYAFIPLTSKAVETKNTPKYFFSTLGFYGRDEFAVPMATHYYTHIPFATISMQITERVCAPLTPAVHLNIFLLSATIGNVRSSS